MAAWMSLKCANWFPQKPRAPRLGVTHHHFCIRAWLQRGDEHWEQPWSLASTTSFSQAAIGFLPSGEATAVNSYHWIHSLPCRENNLNIKSQHLNIKSHTGSLNGPVLGHMSSFGTSHHELLVLGHSPNPEARDRGLQLVGWKRRGMNAGFEYGWVEENYFFIIIIISNSIQETILFFFFF